jgi:hypothetical protein
MDKVTVAGSGAWQMVDVPSGPPQDVMMWRRFRDLSRSVDQEGWGAKQGVQS